MEHSDMSRLSDLPRLMAEVNKRPTWRDTDPLVIFWAPSQDDPATKEEVSEFLVSLDAASRTWPDAVWPARNVTLVVVNRYTETMPMEKVIKETSRHLMFRLVMGNRLSTLAAKSKRIDGCFREGAAIADEVGRTAAWALTLSCCMPTETLSKRAKEDPEIMEVGDAILDIDNTSLEESNVLWWHKVQPQPERKPEPKRSTTGAGRPGGPAEVMAEARAMQSEDTTLTDASRWVESTNFGDLDCQGKKGKTCGGRQSCPHHAWKWGQTQHSGGKDWRQSAWHLLKIMTENFPSKKIPVNTPLDLVRWVIHFVKPKYLDKTLANLGGIACLPQEAVEHARKGNLAQYTVRARHWWKRARYLRQYELSWDPSNEVYANWLYVAVGDGFAEMKKSLENSEQREMWADMVEAALGVCQVAERVPGVQAFFQTDLQLIRTRMENEVSELYHNETLCDQISEITKWGTTARTAPKFDYAFEAKRDYKQIVLAPGVWSDNEVETDVAPFKAKAPKKNEKREGRPAAAATESDVPPLQRAMSTVCLCGSQSAIILCNCEEAKSYRTLFNWICPSTGAPPPKKRRQNEEFLTIAASAWKMIDFLNSKLEDLHGQSGMEIDTSSGSGSESGQDGGEPGTSGEER